MAGIFPEYYASCITEIKESFLQQLHIKAIWLDIGNTISLVDDPLPTPDAEAWIRQMQASGYILGVVSNNDPPRVEPFARSLGLYFRAHAQKPSPDGYRSLAQEVGAAPEECLVVGDQLFTDILGGNHAGMHTVAVPPLRPDMEPKDFRFRRRVERILLRLSRGFHTNRSLTK